MKARIYSWPAGNGGRIPYAQLEGGKVEHVHSSCAWQEGEEAEIVMIARDSESPIRAIPVNDRETMVLNEDQSAFDNLTNADLLNRRLKSGDWVLK